MLPTSVRYACLLLLVSTSMAQQLLQPQRLISPVRDAGTYHVATGTWTRTNAGANPAASLGPDTIFSATAPSGYFGIGWEGSEGIDEGILPGTGNPLGGPLDCYEINGFEFAYCSLAATVDWTFTFYDSYVPCSVPGDACINLVGGITVTDMPTGSACWTVTIDLTGGYEVNMEADGGPCARGYQGALSDRDHFGWGATWVTSDGGFTGPLLSGYDPNYSPPGENTCYNTNLTCPAGTTGLGALDLFEIGAPLSGCFMFGGYANSNGCGGPSQVAGTQFHFEMYTDCASPCAIPCVTTYCEANNAGDLALNDCVLANGPLLNSTGLPVTAQFAFHLIGTGNAVISNPPGSQGDLCLGAATIGYYSADVGPVVGQAFSTDLVNGATGGGAGNLPNSLGGTLAPGQTWNFQTWYRIGPGQSGFSDAITVTFL
jgi:hypothetical protein